MRRQGRPARSFCVHNATPLEYFIYGSHVRCARLHLDTALSEYPPLKLASMCKTCTHLNDLVVKYRADLNESEIQFIEMAGHVLTWVLEGK